MADYPYYTEPTHVQGVVTNAGSNAAKDTQDASTEGSLIVDAVDKIFLLEPNQHPLVTLLTNVGKVWDGKAWKGSSMQKKATGNPEFKSFEDYYGGRYARASAAVAAGGTSISLTGAGSSSGYIFTVGDTAKVARTGENMLVTAVAATSITVTRNYGTTAAAAIVASDGIFIVGNVNEENAVARNTNATLSTPVTNYTQIYKTTIAVSNTEKEANLYGGKDLPYMRAKKGTEHALDIERSFWFGEKKLDNAGTQGHARRATGGILEFINSGNSYVQNQGGALTAPDLNTFLREAFTYGNDTKVLFAGGIVLQAINEIARGQIQTKPLDSTYGIKISTWVSTFGTINIVHNSLFVEEYASYAFCLDMESFVYRYMNNRDTKLHTNVQANDADGQIDQYITEAGLQRSQAPKHALLLGVTS